MLTDLRSQSKLATGSGLEAGGKSKTSCPPLSFPAFACQCSLKTVVEEEICSCSLSCIQLSVLNFFLTGDYSQYFPTPGLSLCDSRGAGLSQWFPCENGEWTLSVGVERGARSHDPLPVWEWQPQQEASRWATTHGKSKRTSSAN